MREFSRGNFQYQELSFSNPRRKARASLSLVRSAIVTHTPTRSISTPPIIRSHPRIPSTYINRSLAYMARAHDFGTFNGGSPLLLAQRHDILVSSLKSIPEFTGETSISPIEHIQEVSNVCNIHGITEDDVVVRLLDSSLKGKALQWYRGLPHKSITDSDGLGAALCKNFEDKSCHLSLLEQLTTIKSPTHECATDFNYRFQKTWDIISTTVKPSPGNAFLYYLRAFNSDIATTLQSMGGNTLPKYYEVSIRAENILIQGGKLSPSPSIPSFPNMPNHQPIVAPIHVSFVSQPLVVVLTASTSSNGIDRIKAMMQKLMQNIDKRMLDQEKKMEDNSVVVQNMGNELVTMNRQQSQNNKLL